MNSPTGKAHVHACLCAAVCLMALPVQAQVTVQVGTNIVATTYVQLSGVGLPPDPDGAVGPKQFVEFINGEFSVFNFTNINNPIRMVDVDFWSGAGVNVGSDVVTDPRVIYDSASGRWFASMVDVNPNAADPTAFANHFLFAVSATSNPLGSWTGFRFLADPDNGYFADFPTLGVDGNAVYLSGDMFQSSVELAASLVSIPKSDLLGATPTIANRTFHGDLDYGTYGMVLQAATCFDGTGSGNVLSVENLGTDDNIYSNIMNFTVLNGNTASASLSTPTNLAGPPYMVPFNTDQGAPLFTPIQPDGTTMLAGNDARFCGRVYCVGGVIYAVHSTEVNGKMAIVWYRVSAASHKLLESGTITNSDLDLFFPAVAANTNGTVIVTCNGCSLNANVSCFAIPGQTINGVTTFGSPILMQAGVNSYHGDDEVYIDPFEGLPPLSRWGDYSTISVDPNNANNFWIIEMYPSDVANNDVWSTQIMQLITTPALALSITQSGTNVMIAWPTFASGFQLQGLTNLTGTLAWTNMPQTVQSNASQFFVLAPIAKGNQYFRLFHP